ncbi:hypothetical protein SprV_0702249300 [Sparganum proliferum]
MSRPSVRPSKQNDKSDCKDGSQSSRIDKRARDEHNEQERSRRRELAVIYELIRCSFSQEDLRHLGPGNAPKSIDKLSYPQVLQIAYHVVREENHNLQLFERTLAEIKRIEKEFLRVGLPVPARPAYPSITETYRKVVNIVDNLLKHDKAARSIDGSYETTPAQRAALGDYQLAFLRPKNYHEGLSSPPPYNSYVAPSMPSSRSTRSYSSVSTRHSLPPVSTRPAESQPVFVSPPVSSAQTAPPKTTVLPRIGTVFKNDYDLSSCLPTPDDDVISSRTMQHSSSTASMEYIDELDLPPVADSLSVEEDLCFFDQPIQHNTFAPDDAPIFPEIPL